MPSNYPGSIDTFATLTDNVSTASASQMNNAQDSILALERYAGGGYNPVTYGGADPTGAADSTTAINSTISAAGSGTVAFPAGTYLVSGANGISSGTATLIGLGRVTIQSTSGTVLTITGNCKLRSITFSGPSTNTSAYGINNPSFNVDALDCKFGAYTNKAGDTGTSTYVACTFTSGANPTPSLSLGSTCWSAGNTFQECTFTGMNGADVQGGAFHRCSFVGNGDGTTSGQGWGIHMPQGTSTIVFAHCYVRGLGLGAYGIGMALTANATFRFCDVEGYQFGLYYHDNAYWVAEYCSFRGNGASGATNCFGVECNKAGTGGAPLTGASLAYFCEFRALTGNKFDLSVPTNANNGSLTTFACHWSVMGADDGGDLTNASLFLLNREAEYKKPVTLDTNSTTPTISQAGTFYQFAYTAATTVTNILGAVAGQRATFRCANANTITFSTSGTAPGNIATTKQASIGPNAVAEFIYDGASWYGVV